MFQKSRKSYIVIAILFVISFIFYAGYSHAQVHTIISSKPLYVEDGETGMWYTPIKGTATMSWSNKTRDGFFRAKALVCDKDAKILYSFNLVAISNCNDDYIEGLWDIRKNGSLVCNGCVGKAYDINAPIGGYFKLYIGDSQCYDEKWHLSAYITNRIDF